MIHIPLPKYNVTSSPRQLQRVWRKVDGGATWRIAYKFTAESDYREVGTPQF
jgi:hypothetical protein